MNTWLPPYRICVLKNDLIAIQALTKVLENNKMWEIIYTETFWESCLLAINCGLHAIFLNDSLQNSDLQLEIFDQARFFACRKLPVPYLLVKISPEFDESILLKYPLTKGIKSIGIINHLKTELAHIEKEISTKNTPYYKYSEFQFLSFVKGQLEVPGGILLNAFSEEYFFHANVWACFMENKIKEGEFFLKNALTLQSNNIFYQATAAIFYYQQQKLNDARENLAPLANKCNTNPFLLYLAFNIADQFQDFQIQFALLKILELKFKNSYITSLATAIWNCRMGKDDISLFQLLGCLEKLPHDLIVACELVKILHQKKYTGLFSGVKNYASSFLLKSNMSQYIYSDLLNFTD